jgi:hypothetical protein
MHRSGWRFCRKVVKDVYILLISFAFCVVPSFHCMINVLITSGMIFVCYTTGQTTADLEISVKILNFVIDISSVIKSYFI